MPPMPLELKQRVGRPFWLNVLLALASLYFFLCAINVMGAGLKSIGKETSWLADAIAQGDNPMVALMASVLVTSIVQSSSFTTSLIITLVAAGELSAGNAVFAVMGANFGTSITSLIVSLGTMRIKRQFRRAYATALMHAIPNVLTVVLLFPLEWATSTTSADGFTGGFLTRISRWITSLLDIGSSEKFFNPIKAITQPVVTIVKDAAGLVSGENATAAATVVAVVGLVILFVSLLGLVKNLKDALLQRLEGLFTVLIFRNDLLAWLSGIVSTVAVQSSSVTTSLIVPIAGAGAVKLRRVFPFMLGCNIGTTVTGLIAATAIPTEGAVIVAISHVLFNVANNVIWYPLRVIPIRLAKWYSAVAARQRKYAFIFLAAVFLIIPTVALIISELIFFSD
jgi:sodium-dependent phosphate cotransporter